MKKIIKVVGMGLLTVVVLMVLIITVSFINHRVNLSQEESLFIPNGQMVKVNDHFMHVYMEGEGESTLVFMSGGGTSSPVLDFKSLYSLLSDDYRIVVVEKAGYGFSEVADVDRDIETILSETREALKQAEVSGPYLLMPHSMSGIEALYWAQMYPEEVLAIIGLDMSVPESYENYTINKPMINLSAFAARVGMTRWIPGISESDAIKYGTLTKEEREIYRAIFYRRTATSTMLKEVSEIKSNASIVEKGVVPSIPILLFSSNGSGTGWDEAVWKNYQQRFIEQVDDGEIVDLDCSHYVHDIKYEMIADKTKEFIRGLH